MQPNRWRRREKINALEIHGQAVLDQHVHGRQARLLEGGKRCELGNDVLWEGTFTAMMRISAMLQQLSSHLEVPYSSRVKLAAVWVLPWGHPHQMVYMHVAGGCVGQLPSRSTVRNAASVHMAHGGEAPEWRLVPSTACPVADQTGQRPAFTGLFTCVLEHIWTQT